MIDVDGRNEFALAGFGELEGKIVFAVGGVGGCMVIAKTAVIGMSEHAAGVAIGEGVGAEGGFGGAFVTHAADCARVPSTGQ